MSFSGKVVIVTGASSGIGAAAAEQFAREGARVALVDRDEAGLARVAQRCAAHGVPPLVVRADLTNEQEASTVVENTINHFGQLDVLVNNAGISKRGTLLDGNLLEGYDVIMKTNVRTPIQLTSLAAPYLIKTKGNIINISGAGSLFVPPTPQQIILCVSKAALDHFTRCAALELAGAGVRVNSVNPGPVKTDFIEKSGLPNSDDIREHKKQTTALGRIGEPQEIADLIVFLASDKAKSMTGSIYVSDNGYMLKAY